MYIPKPPSKFFFYITFYAALLIGDIPDVLRLRGQSNYCLMSDMVNYLPYTNMFLTFRNSLHGCYSFLKSKNIRDSTILIYGFYEINLEIISVFIF